MEEDDAAVDDSDHEDGEEPMTEAEERLEIGRVR